ncbi:nuclear transport factor 2 family protein [Acinetobacter sp. ANC 3813]|uniref:nuclear transport factor 2 family protein n=1 Tax=Acinetobacter sp. ANC 3813 TaxID=1977873 RepID=UPI000A33893C|nr:nuclear transport factor 2 family protein [Acinetobacter sp. ANC 3813]OTG90503.1 hypothetical protein B9T34_08355 [Acinetobacter sp. ANC 3813]
MKITGDLSAGQEIMTVLERWDQAICSLDMHEIVEYCAADVSLFDVTMELCGISAYQQIWNIYKDYFRKGLKVFRDRINIYAEHDIAFVYCFSKIDVESGIPTPGISWCRTTICFKKKKDKWKIIHQHISLPISAESVKRIEWEI